MHFEGYVPPDCLPGYYQRADVFCSPSTVNESFGITLLEAMAAHAPAVATSINGSNTLGEDGVTGLIVPPKDADRSWHTRSCACSIDRSLAASLADAAQERARRFDWQEIAKSLLAYYEELGRLSHRRELLFLQTASARTTRCEADPTATISPRRPSRK